LIAHEFVQRHFPLPHLPPDVTLILHCNTANVTMQKMMLQCVKDMRNLLQDFERYIQTVLGITVAPVRWEDNARVPFYLREQYTLYQFQLLGTPCLLMVAEGETAVTAIRKHIQQLKNWWNGEVIYLLDALSSRNRKRLIEEKVAFAIPGNQLYFPPLGVDLREHFRALHPPVTIFSPSTQAVIIHTLRRRIRKAETPSSLAKQFGYTRMTMTRAFDELEMAGLGEFTSEGRERVLRFADENNVLWEKARGLLRSPVKQRLWLTGIPGDFSGLQAGLTALSRYSLLAAPAQRVYALSVKDWAKLKQQQGIVPEVIPVDEPDAIALEIWSYPPQLFAEQDVVDPLSLFLSLQHLEDERVESALEEMMEKAVW